MKSVFGMVVSNKMQKSLVVAVDRLFHNKLYNRYVKRTSKFMALDELNNIGDRHLCRRRKLVNVRSRQYSSSSYNEKGFPDERAMKEDAERKIGWFFKLIFAGTATIIGYNIFPYLGDNLIQQSVSLLNVKDPLFKRMGASRLTQFATDDERRMKIVELGGAQKLVEMLGAAKDDSTRKEALNAIIAIARSDEAVGVLHTAGAISVIMATPKSAEDAEIEIFKAKLLKRFQDMKYDENAS